MLINTSQYSFLKKNTDILIYYYSTDIMWKQTKNVQKQLDNVKVVKYEKFKYISITGCRDMGKNAPKMGASVTPEDFFTKIRPCHFCT